mgnify:CR=1 FL=1
MSLISIIIPVYNAENYLEKCLNSLINQTYKNLEIIIVNDGSTDNSASICEEFLKNDIRIKYFYKENEAVVPRLPYFLNISNAGASMCCEAQGITMSTT